MDRVLFSSIMAVLLPVAFALPLLPAYSEPAQSKGAVQHARPIQGYYGTKAGYQPGDAFQGGPARTGEVSVTLADCAALAGQVQVQAAKPVACMSGYVCRTTHARGMAQEICLNDGRTLAQN